MRSIRITIISMITVGLLAGSAVGVAAQSAVVTGSISSGDECQVTPEGAESCTGGRFEFDDPRLTGDYDKTQTFVMAPDLGGAVIATEDFRVTNDEGAWSGRYVFGSFFQDDELVSGGNNWLLTGEGAYDGLTAWVYEPAVEGGTTQGIIIQAEPME